MKKSTWIISMAVALLMLFGCGNPNGAAGELRVVTTIFPLYDFTREVVGDDDVDVVCLVDGSADMHSFSPSSQDIIAISQCDVFIYVGGESDEWVDEVLAQYPDDDRIVVCCFDVLGGRLLAEDAPDEDEYDEHVWMSLRNAAIMTEAIAEALGRAVPEHAEAYASNAAGYVEQLEALDARYQQVLAGGGTLLVADRFPFAYLANDYGLECHAAFSGCSAEAEVSFQVVAQLADVLNEHELTHVFVIDDGDTAVAEAVISQAGRSDVEVLSLYSMQAVSKRDMDEGASYLALMELNLEVLEEGLSR